MSTKTGEETVMNEIDDSFCVLSVMNKTPVLKTEGNKWGEINIIKK